MKPENMEFLRKNGRVLALPLLSESYDEIPKEITVLFSNFNGLTLFRGALIIRPYRSIGRLCGIVEWNKVGLWKASYPRELSLAETVFFAEDVLGVQFGWRSGSVVAMEPETGETETIGRSLDDFVSWIRQDPGDASGAPILGRWIDRNGPLPLGKRLLPGVPFICNGSFEPENLAAVDDAEAMRFRGSLASQIKDLPDGSEILLRVE